MSTMIEQAEALRAVIRCNCSVFNKDPFLPRCMRCLDKNCNGLCESYVARRHAPGCPMAATGGADVE